MKITIRRPLTMLAAGLVLAGAGLAAPATAADAAHHPAAAAAHAPVRANTATVFDLNGTFAIVGVGYVTMSDVNDILTVTMTAVGRPTARGVVINNDTIIITFPDTGTSAAKLVAPDTINWAGGSTWRRVTMGSVPNVIGLTRTAAGAALTSAGFLTRTKTVLVCFAELNTVEAQDPPGGAQAIHGTFVTLTFEANRPPKLCQ